MYFNKLMIFPELIIVVLFFFIWINNIFNKKNINILNKIILLFIVISSILFLRNFILFNNTKYYFYNMYVFDKISNFFKFIITFGYVVSMIYSSRYLKFNKINENYFFLLSILSLLGQLIIISSNNYLILYLGLELTSLSLYPLILLNCNLNKSIESSIKYYVMNTIASGFLLYGISTLYGITGKLDILGVSDNICLNSVDNKILIFGLFFIIFGIAFKIGLVPFHMWLPDVYQGSPTVVTLIICGIFKISIFAWVFRFLIFGLFCLSFYYKKVIKILSILSLIIGNIAGINQNNFKRMLAYSSIANMGFMFLSFLENFKKDDVFLIINSYSYSMFYIIVYFVSVLGSLGSFIILSNKDSNANEISDLKGLSKRSFLLSFILMVSMLSLAGIPVTGGFYSKFLIIKSLINSNFIFLSILAIIMSLIGSFYYLRVIKIMYFDNPVNKKSVVVISNIEYIFLILNLFIIIYLGFFPDKFIFLCFNSISNLFISKKIL